MVMIPQVFLVLATALLCVAVFFVFSVFRRIPVAVPLLTAPAVALSAWVLAPEWTFVLLPYVVVGGLSGLAAVAVVAGVANVLLPIAVKASTGIETFTSNERALAISIVVYPALAILLHLTARPARSAGQDQLAAGDDEHDRQRPQQR